MKVLHNVMVGEVWVCSGQSNMEMPLEGWRPRDTISNSAYEIANANFPSLRMFSVRRSYEASPSDNCDGKWLECSPRTAPSFSATAFFFGKILHEKLNVPVGLINTSYGGTPVEAWMSREALKSFKEFKESLSKLEGSGEGLRILRQWVDSHPSINMNDRDPSHKWDGLKFQDDSCSSQNYEDRTWYEMKLPMLWERASLGEFDGTVWFRKNVAIPSAWVGKDLVLHLGPIDDMDETYVEGEQVGKYMGDGFWSVDRVYKIAGSIVRDSVLSIAIRVIDTQGGGGIYGNEKNFYIAQNDTGSRMPLAGDWKYLPVAEYRSNIFSVFGASGNEFANRPKLSIPFSAKTPTVLYNAMVHPFVPYAIRGTIWYQGEENTGRPYTYRKLFTTMIGDWRRVFHSGDFPFYFVQLAPYDYGDKTKSQLIREAQLQTMSVRNTGMAVTLDIGNPKNIHPSDKLDVGKRLALWALAKTYVKNSVYSGPLPGTMKKEKDKIVLSFQHSEKGLILKNLEAGNRFKIAGSDKQFKDAEVKIRGNTLVISCPDILHPQAVRYAFTNTDEATLFNGEGLPAPSFRTDSWEE
jgi:sialate O-acetylesterase